MCFYANMYQNVHLSKVYSFFPFYQESSTNTRPLCEFDYVTAFHQNTPDSPSVWTSSNSSTQSLSSRRRGTRPNKHMLNVISCFVAAFLPVIFFHHSFLPPWWFTHFRQYVLSVQDIYATQSSANRFLSQLVPWCHTGKILGQKTGWKGIFMLEIFKC